MTKVLRQPYGSAIKNRERDAFVGAFVPKLYTQDDVDQYVRGYRDISGRRIDSANDQQSRVQGAVVGRTISVEGWQETQRRSQIQPLRTRKSQIVGPSGSVGSRDISFQWMAPPEKEKHRRLVSSKESTESSSATEETSSVHSPVVIDENKQFPVRWVQLPTTNGNPGFPVPLILQEKNEQSSLIAIANILFQREKITLDYRTENISAGDLIHIMEDCIRKATTGKKEIKPGDIDDALEFLPTMLSRLKVKLKFTSPEVFAVYEVADIFEWLGVPLVHGWLIDPTQKDLAKAICDRIWPEVMEFIGNADPNDAEAALVREFVQRSEKQLTAYGISNLKAQMKNGSFTVIYRDNNFEVLTKNAGELYRLKTETGFTQNRRLFWESLDLDINIRLVDCDFKEEPPAASMTLPPLPIPNRHSTLRQLDLTTDDRKLAEKILRTIVDGRGEIAFENIVGLQDAKEALKISVLFPLVNQIFLRPPFSPAKGILLYGPPGNGKTMLAKAIAAATIGRVTVFAVSAADIISKWFGDSEQLMKLLFDVARVNQPSVIFMDKIDTLLPDRNADVHETIKRTTAVFFDQLDGIRSKSNDRVLVLGATSRPFALDTAAIRRFENRIYVRLPDEVEREELLMALLAERRSTVIRADVKTISKMTVGYSNSDLKILIECATDMTVEDSTRGKSLEEVHSMQANQIRPVCMADMIDALSRVKTSVAQSSIADIESFNRIH